MEGLQPETPAEAGVPERTADAGHEEGARVLADEAYAVLADSGFTAEEVREWAETFIAEEGTGDVDDLVAWIREKEQGRGRRTGSDGAWR